MVNCRYDHGWGVKLTSTPTAVDTKVTPIWNTMAAIPGHIKNEVVLIGCHRDGTYTAFHSLCLVLNCY